MKRMKILQVGIVRVPAKIQTRHLPDTNQMITAQVNLFSAPWSILFHVQLPCVAERI
jgi:hypothetical protein